MLALAASMLDVYVSFFQYIYAVPWELLLLSFKSVNKDFV